MLKCATSLWSADLANLGEAMRRVAPYSERFHLDVADGRYVPTMLFFPDLVAQLRTITKVPFEVHLMTVRPDLWVEPFAEAGADGILFCLDSCDNPAGLLKAIKTRGMFAGVSLLLTEGLDRLESLWPSLDLLTIMGTAMGVKGALMDESVPAKVREARRIIDARGLRCEVEVDGGIRRDSVPRLHAAGADWIVPGSLMFGGDPSEMRSWLASLA